MARVLGAVAVLALFGSCSSGSKDPTAPDAGTADTAFPALDASSDTAMTDPELDADLPPEFDADDDPDAVKGPPFCGIGMPLAGVAAPAGFCLRQFARIAEARTLTFAPNGDLFVGAPSMATPGGAKDGPGAIVVLSDDDHDGIAEQTDFAEGLPDVHGLAIGGGYLYFTTATGVSRTPYMDGQRHETGPRESLSVSTKFGQGGRWTHALARSVGGNLFTARGEYGSCGNSAGGDIYQLAMTSWTTVASGFRNPLFMRCHHRDELCAANELGEDQIPGAREKLVALRPNKVYGYPCCFTANKPVSGAPLTSCTNVAVEDASFTLSDTPFGLDWEHDLWPAPYRGGLFVALHGSFYSSPGWAGARIVYARTDPQTHMPVEAWRDFLGGFGPGGTPLERPTDIVFAPDGRMFFADDAGGGVYWIAPNSLARPN